jgi:hypothetical protein
MKDYMWMKIVMGICLLLIFYLIMLSNKELKIPNTKYRITSGYSHEKLYTNSYIITDHCIAFTTNKNANIILCGSYKIEKLK